MTAVEEAYASQTLALAGAETLGWDWTTCTRHDTPVVHHVDAPCPGCDPDAPRDGRCIRCLELLTDPDDTWCSVRCRAADMQPDPAASAAWEAGQ